MRRVLIWFAMIASAGWIFVCCTASFTPGYFASLRPISPTADEMRWIRLQEAFWLMMAAVGIAIVVFCIRALWQVHTAAQNERGFDVIKHD